MRKARCGAHFPSPLSLSSGTTITTPSTMPGHEVPMKSVQRVKAIVGARGTLRLLEPVNLPAGEKCEVVVLLLDAEWNEELEMRPLVPALKRLVGFWDKRDDIDDPVEYAAKLRSDLEAGRDRRG